jgi:N-methylhydantoinase B
MEARSLPDDMSELNGKRITLGLREENFVQRPQDVYAVAWSAGGGFGDPMERRTAQVLDDWANGLIATTSALDIYGVVIDTQRETVNEGATAVLRANARKKRIASVTSKPSVLTGPKLFQTTETMAVASASQGAHFCCVKCAADLGSIDGNYKNQCVLEEKPIRHATPLAGDARDFIDAVPILRQFYCPGCGALIENEVAIAGSSIVRDIALDPLSGRA